MVAFESFRFARFSHGVAAAAAAPRSARAKLLIIVASTSKV
jgi:hypothetical protein